jgi:hypothetical protein
MGLFDSLFGKKKKGNTIEAPKVLDLVSFRDAQGNTYSIRNKGDTQFVDESVLSAETQGQVNVAQKGVSTLLQELGESNAQRQTNLDKRQQELYKPLADEITRLLDGQSAQLRSQESKRFGGALNSTFSATALGGVATTRLRALESAYAGTYSSALNEMLSLDGARESRFSSLQRYLDTVEDRKQRYTLAGLNSLEASRGLRLSAFNSSSKSSGSGDFLSSLFTEENIALASKIATVAAG